MMVEEEVSYRIASPKASAASFSLMASAMISLPLSFFDFFDFLPDGEAPPRNGTIAEGILFECAVSNDHTANASTRDCVDRFISSLNHCWVEKTQL